MDVHNNKTYNCDNCDKNDLPTVEFDCRDADLHYEVWVCRDCLKKAVDALSSEEPQ